MPFSFGYAPHILARFSTLRSAGLLIDNVDPHADPAAAIRYLTAVADERLAKASEGDFPEIQAWRRAFSAMGLKPTQYRCASEALLRRYRKEGALPALHPLVDLCNAASLAFALPVAVFDVDRIDGALTVQSASGSEIYETFGGGTEHPEPGEIVFADESDRAHARRWTNRQSGRSAVRERTSRAFVITEGLHDSAGIDGAALASTVAEAVGAHWANAIVSRVNPT